MLTGARPGTPEPYLRNSDPAFAARAAITGRPAIAEVAAGATQQAIPAGACNQAITSGTTVHPIWPLAALQYIPASLAEQAVAATAAVQLVVADPTTE